MRTVTHQDVIDYLEAKGKDTVYKVHEGKLHITGYVPFRDFKFSTLPQGMVFECACDLSDSGIVSLPDDLVLNSNLYLSHTKISTLPVLYIGGTMNISETDLVILDGTYIEYELYSYGTIDEHLNRLYINGYFFSTGVLT